MNVNSDPDPVTAGDAEFPHAPGDWRQEHAERSAREEGIEPGPDHSQALRCR